MSPKNSYHCVGFKQLILEALLENPDHMLPLKELYAVLQQKEPSLCERKSDWKGTVRHILSAMPNFVRVPDHSKRGVWAITDTSMYTRRKEEDISEGEEDVEQSNQMNSSPSDEEEIELPEIVIPSQWNNSWSNSTLTSFQMNSNELPQSSHMNEHLTFYKNGQTSVYQTEPSSSNFVRESNNFTIPTEFQTQSYHSTSQSEWLPIQEFLHQYPDIFQNLNQRQF